MKFGSKTAPPRSKELFPDEPSGPPAGVHVANIDGASRGNPGPASYAVVLRDASGKVVLELAKHFGRDTNNVAEYYALLAALDYAATHGITALRIRSDSELLVRQMLGRYKVKSADLKPLYERAVRTARQLAYFTIEHVRREENREADALANVALDSGPVSNASLHAPAPSPAAASHHSQPPGAARGRQIHARFIRGALVPSEPLELPEGAEVLIDVHPKPRTH